MGRRVGYEPQAAEWEASLLRHQVYIIGAGAGQGSSSTKSIEDLRHRADAPGDEFLVPEAFGARPAAAGHFEQRVEDLPADLLDGGSAIGNRACVDIHVIRNAAEGMAVGGDP